MLRRHSVNHAVFSILLDMGLTFFALYLAGAVRPYFPTTIPFLVPVDNIHVPNAIFLIVPIVWGFTFLLMSVYDPLRIYKAVDELQMVTFATIVATLIFSGVLYLAFREFSRWMLVTFVLIDLALLLGWRILARFMFRTTRLPSANRRVLIVGAGDTGRRVGEMIGKYQWAGLTLSGYLDDNPEKQNRSLPLLGRLDNVREVVAQFQIDDVVVALPRRAYGQVNKLVVELHDLPVQVRVVPDYFSLALYRATVDNFGGLPMINLRDPALNEVQRFIKRIFDLTISVFTLLLLSPILVLVALLIKLDSSGSVIYRQDRVGENGRIFYMYKFRTMVEEADQLLEQVTEVNSQGQLLFKRPNDPRVTRIGRLLRRTSLDEIPQLFNVIKGDMSLVGPRPELPWLVESYEPWQRKRFAVPQGMTGWWQIHGRSDKPMHLHTQDDLYYVQNYSLWMDIYILLKTPWIVMRGKGAY